MQTKSNDIHAPLYYETHKDKACMIIAEQLSNDWSIKDIVEFFLLIGYDYFFVRAIINPLVIKSGWGNIWN